MLHMNQIDQIKVLQREAYRPSEIGKRIKVDRKTVAHYMNQEDFNGSLEVVKLEGSKLDRFKPKIDEWLLEDRQMRYKQRHTAKRIHERLKEEYAKGISVFLCPSAKVCEAVQRSEAGTSHR